MDNTEGYVARLGATLGDLEASMAGAEHMSAAFRAEMDGVKASFRETSRDAGVLSRSLGRELRSAVDDMIFNGGRLSDVLANLGRSMASTVLNQALTPVTNSIGEAIVGGVGRLMGSFTGFEKGGAFASGRVAAFASGGVVQGPTLFPMRGGTGLMGEAGPEAIMPLTRGADGRLGVRAQGQGGRPVNVTFNISTPDVAGFARSQTQIAAQMTRALRRGNRNM